MSEQKYFAVCRWSGGNLESLEGYGSLTGAEREQFKNSVRSSLEARMCLAGWEVLENQFEDFLKHKKSRELLSSKEFYNYIVENFTLDGVARRLVGNIVSYVNNLGLADQEDVHDHLDQLLDGAFGIERGEIERAHFD